MGGFPDAPSDGGGQLGSFWIIMSAETPGRTQASHEYLEKGKLHVKHCSLIKGDCSRSQQVILEHRGEANIEHSCYFKGAVNFVELHRCPGTLICNEAHAQLIRYQISSPPAAR